MPILQLHDTEFDYRELEFYAQKEGFNSVEEMLSHGVVKYTQNRLQAWQPALEDWEKLKQQLFTFR